MVICQNTCTTACVISPDTEQQRRRLDFSMIFSTVHSMSGRYSRSTTNQNIPPSRTYSISQAPAPASSCRYFLSSSLTSLQDNHSFTTYNDLQTPITEQDIIMLSPIKLLIFGIATLALAAPVIQSRISADVYKRAPVVMVTCEGRYHSLSYSYITYRCKSWHPIRSNIQQGRDRRSPAGT